jgi:hypothetical protein
MTREELNVEIQNEIIKEQNKEQAKKIIKIAVKILSFIFIFGACFFSYTTYVSTTKIGVKEYRIKNSKLPESYNGLKIIQFSDLHYGSTMTLKDVKKIVKLSNERKPDIVVFTGDLISKNYNLSPKEQEKLTKELKKITYKLGKYTILGDEDKDTITTIYNQSDFTLLSNDYDLIYKNDNNPILLVGLNSPKNNQNIENAYRYFKEETHNSNIYTISILHEPDIVDNIQYNTDLFLAGHSHNGNIKIPFINYPITKYENAKKYNQEYYKLNNSELFISSGLGTNKVDIRLFCRPSINFFRISQK